MAGTTEKRTLTPQFKEYLNAALSKEEYLAVLKNYNLKTREEFGKFVAKHLGDAIEPKNSTITIETLQNLLNKTIFACLKLKLEQSEYNKLKAKLDKIMFNKQQLTVKLLQAFLQEILSKHMDKIINILWEAYFDTQQENFYFNMAENFSKNKNITQIAEMQLTQASADPGKRIGILLSEALYTLFNFAVYKNTLGEQKLPVDNNQDSAEENPFYKMNRWRYGTNIPGAAGPAGP